MAAITLLSLFLLPGAAGDDGSAFNLYTGETVSDCTTAALVSQLTGPESAARTDERWNVAGTDLGIAFEYDGELRLAFGDTWGRDGVHGDDWRANTMGTIEPDDANGYILTDMITGDNGEAIELLEAVKEPKVEYTVNPTAAIAVDDRIYLHYMSVNDWDQDWWGYKLPVLNGSGIAYSDDGGQTWVKDERAVWQGDTPFAQAAMVRDDGYVYIFGTPAGRFGAAILLRVDEDEVLNPNEYEFWDGAAWTADPYAAAIVVPAPVGELSVQWSGYHGSWLMMYTNEVEHTIVLRTAEELTGPWDSERTVVSTAEYPSLYAPYMLPEINGPEIFFTMSIFERSYQVYLMRVTLDRCQ